MSQYFAYQLAGGQLILDLQTDFIDTGSRVVAPLVPMATGPKPLGRLEPVFQIDGQPYVLHTAELAAIPTHLLGSPVADLSAFDYEIKGALDMVFSGF